jgi:hypothetical protein
MVSCAQITGTIFRKKNTNGLVHKTNYTLTESNILGIKNADKFDIHK